MQEPHRGVANHSNPESCAGGGNITGEALGGELMKRSLPPHRGRRRSHCYSVRTSSFPMSPSPSAPSSVSLPYAG
jgi:hypothetical protein